MNEISRVGIEDVDFLSAYLFVELEVDECFELVFDFIELINVDFFTGDKEVSVDLSTKT